MENVLFSVARSGQKKIMLRDRLNLWTRLIYVTDYFHVFRQNAENTVALYILQ